MTVLMGLPKDVAERHDALVRTLAKLSPEQRTELILIIRHTARTATVTRRYLRDVVLITRACKYAQFYGSPTRH